MKKYILLTLVLASLAIACSKVPVSGRKQLNLLPEGELTKMALSSYQQVLGDAKVIRNSQEAALVKKTGTRIAQAVETYLARNKLGKRVKDFKWEFNLIDENVANAWAMPGGKVAIYTGILPVTQSETGLAVVMGHEVAHAVARHGNERMSQGMLQQLGGLALAVALRNKPQQTQAMFMNAYGVGSQVGAALPFSRKQETEADELGLIFMAMAGYSPQEAPAFWQRMNGMSKGQAPPEFMSTHPSHATRTKNLQKYIPQAMAYFKKGYTPSNINTANYKSSTQSNTGSVSNKPKPTSGGNRTGTKVSTGTKTKTGTTSGKKAGRIRGGKVKGGVKGGGS